MGFPDEPRKSRGIASVLAVAAILIASFGLYVNNNMGEKPSGVFCNLGAPLGSIPEGWEWRNDRDCNLFLVNEAGRRAPASVYAEMEFPIEPPPAPEVPLAIWVIWAAAAVLLGGAAVAWQRSRPTHDLPVHVEMSGREH